MCANCCKTNTSLKDFGEVFAVINGFCYIVTSLLPETLKNISNEITVVMVRIVARAAAVP